VPFVRANGLSFHVQELGHGPTVVLIHGMFLGNLASWYFSVAPILAARRRVFMYDQRGHGRSERAPTGYDLATLAADLHALVARNAGELDLVGHSYGALVALRFALEHPQRVRRLVVVEAPLPPQQAQPFDADPDDLARVAEPARLRAAIARAGHDADELLGRLLPPGLARALLGSPRRLRSLFGALHALLCETTIRADVAAEPDLSDARLSEIRQPTLCVYGASSPCRAAGDRLAAGLPQAALRVLDCGHYVVAERPLELAAAVGEFFDG
jgi:pimeloyl-ACP methyl ester carboxylesterase